MPTGDNYYHYTLYSDNNYHYIIQANIFYYKVNMIIKPSKKIFITAIVASVLLHGFICKIPVQSAVIEDEVYKKINISLLSLAAPSIDASRPIEEVEEVKEVVKQEVKPVKTFAEKIAKKVEKKKVKQVTSVQRKTSNNNGSEKSTVTPILSVNDYVKTVAPIYPKMAIRRGVEGKVMVKVKVGANGKPRLVSIKSSSGDKSLDKSALAAVSKWDFKSSAFAKSQGSWVVVPVKFIIQ